jgi:hypothetical protein
MGKAFADNLEHANHSYSQARYTDAMAKAGTQAEVDALALEEVKVRVLSERYLAHYGEPDIREASFDSPMFGEGRIDGIEIRGLNRIGIEDKFLTKGFFHTANEEQLHIDAQVTAYMAAMRDAGTPLYKMKYRITWKPSIKPDSRKGESLEQYERRLRDRIIADPSYAFSEYELYRSDEELDRFIQRSNRINKMVKQCKQDEKNYTKREDAWPQQLGTACTLYGGCDYLALCKGDADVEDKYRLIPERPTGRHMDALAALGMSLTSATMLTDIASYMGLADHLVRYSMTKLAKMGLVEQIKVGRLIAYKLTESGLTMLDS